MIRMQSTLLVILPTWAVFSLSLSLSPQILPILYQHLSQRTVNKTFWSNPRQTRICCVFRRNHACLQNHTNHNDARSILLQLKSSLPFSLFLLVWRLESTTTKSLFRHLHCRGSPLSHSSLCSWAGVCAQIANNMLFWLRLSKIEARQCLSCKWRFAAR